MLTQTEPRGGFLYSVLPEAGVEPARAQCPRDFQQLSLAVGLCLHHIFRLRWLVYSLYTFINNWLKQRKLPTLYLISLLMLSSARTNIFNLARRSLSYSPN